MTREYVSWCGDYDTTRAHTKKNAPSLSAGPRMRTFDEGKEVR
jgi:hypothetical protein